MKKLLLTLGSAAAIAAPVAAVVACSNTDNNKDGGKNNKGHEIDDKMATISEINPFKNVKEDGLYLWKDHYTGKVWNGDTSAAGKESKNEIERIGDNGGYGYTSTVQLGKDKPTDKEDSIYMVYDDDDSDGISIDNFTDTLYFEDTSVMMDDAIYKLNHDIFGNVTVPGSFGKAEYIAFTEDAGKKDQGSINTYIGSQNNHVSSGHGYSTSTDFSKKLMEFIDEYNDKQPEAVKKLLTYYGLKFDSKGEVVEDSSILNHASRGFAPVYYTKPIFTYKKVFKNVLEITYHDRPGFACTAAHFRLKQQDGSYKGIGMWSLAKKDWSAFWGHPETKYTGYKGPVSK